MANASAKAAYMAMIARIPVVPYGRIASQSFQFDPILLTGTIDSTHLDVNLTEVLQPATVGTSGVFGSKGTNSPFVGWITGVTVSPAIDVSEAAIKEHLGKVFFGLVAGGQNRYVPLAECIRLQPFINVLDQATPADASRASTCGPPGKPAYTFAEPVAWEGNASDLIKLLVALTNPTTPVSITNSVAYSVRVYGAWMPGGASDVGAICDKAMTNIAPSVQKEFSARNFATLIQAALQK